MGINDLDPTEVFNSEMERATKFFRRVNGATDEVIQALDSYDREIEDVAAILLRQPKRPFPKARLNTANTKAVNAAFSAMRSFGLRVAKEEAEHAFKTLGGNEDGLKPLTDAELREIVDSLKFLKKTTAEHKSTFRVYRIGLIAEELNTLQQARKAGAIINPGIELVSLKRGRDGLSAIFGTYAPAVREAVRKRFYKRNPKAVGIFYWSSIIDNRTTLLCRAMNGATRKPGDKEWSNGMAPEYPNHPNERSVILNLPASAIKSNKRLTLSEWLHSLPPEKQEEILGPARYKLWKSNKVGLSGLLTKGGRKLRLDELPGKATGKTKKAAA